MSRFLKTFMLWLLVLALPVQGLAATIKASCSESHRQHVLLLEPAKPPSHLQEQQAHHGHHAHDTHAVPPVHHDAADKKSDSAGSDTVHASCSACATCCTGALAPPALLDSMPADTQLSGLAMGATVSFSGFIPPSPERPPRSFLV